MPKEKETKEEEKTPQYFYGLGRRKRATAKVFLRKGEGFVINNHQAPPRAKIVSLAPLNLIGKPLEFKVEAKVRGGGKTSQLEAICLGLARALVQMDQDLRPTLRKAGLLTRDSREKERKKPGLKRARRAPQWSKR